MEVYGSILPKMEVCGSRRECLYMVYYSWLNLKRTEKAENLQTGSIPKHMPVSKGPAFFASFCKSIEFVSHIW